MGQVVYEEPSINLEAAVHLEDILVSSHVLPYDEASCLTNNIRGFLSKILREAWLMLED